MPGGTSYCVSAASDDLANTHHTSGESLHNASWEYPLARSVPFLFA